jgi:hypothetical protein
MVIEDDDDQGVRMEMIETMATESNDAPEDC